MLERAIVDRRLVNPGFVAAVGSACSGILPRLFSRNLHDWKIMGVCGF
jgi:hypothetical protein